MARRPDLSARGGDDEVSDLRWRYRESAAVLSYFDPAALKPRGADNDAPGGAARQLLADAVAGHQPGREGLWILRANIRKEALARLATRDRMLEALAITPGRLDDPLQCALEACISGTTLRLADDLDTARAAVQAVEWLNGILDNLPDLPSLRDRVDFLALVQPFRQLAGSYFQGRSDELARLAQYIGIYDGPLHRYPLMIVAPGGFGKSTLLAKFLLTHMGVNGPMRVLFAYIDFDRPGFIDSPVAVLREAGRQLAIQCPGTRELSVEFRRLASGTEDEWPRLIDSFAALADAATGETSRFVLVLDTVEEIQSTGPPTLQSLWQMLEALQHTIPQMRLVLASRAPMMHQRIDLLQLGQFDPEAAAAFLESRGVPTDLAGTLTKHVGGTPLALQLAADLVTRQGAPGVIHDLYRRSFSTLEGALQEGYLYQRIVAHIHDPEVQKLAHPGFVLRRITPETILEVLSGPCGLTVQESSDAQRLFEGLRREIGLVVQEEGMSLRPRPDLRRIMLPLIRRDQPRLVVQIHQNAVAYFQAQSGLIARAEEIYHRLSLDQRASEIDARWIPGVEQYLRSAIEEVGPRAQRYLSSRFGNMLNDDGSSDSK
jgi:hypothetical protein